MRIAVFGASGRTGQILVKKALEAGHTVSALFRDPSRGGKKRRALAMVQGDVLDYGAVERTVVRADAVVCALGHCDASPPSVVSRGMTNIVMAMQRAGVRRIVSVGAAGMLGELRGARRLFAGALSGRRLSDHGRAYRILAESGLDWTVVRVLRLVDGAPAETPPRVVLEGAPAGPVSRASLARFMLDALAKGDYIRTAPAIAD